MHTSSDALRVRTRQTLSAVNDQTSNALRIRSPSRVETRIRRTLPTAVVLVEATQAFRLTSALLLAIGTADRSPDRQECSGARIMPYLIHTSIRDVRSVGNT